MRLFGLLMGVAAIAACGDGAETKDLFGARVCVAGTTIECACPGGTKGAQSCRDDGTGYEACQCGGGAGSGGSAGSGAGMGGSAGTGGSGTGGAGGGCTPRSMCPAPDPDGGAPLCGMLDDYCGGKLSCGCEFGNCIGGACECKRLPEWDQLCRSQARGPLAMQCAVGVKPPDGCELTPGGFGYPPYSLCCKH